MSQPDERTTYAVLAGGGPPLEQFARLLDDARAVVKGRRSRWLTLPFNEAFAIVCFYRLNRAGYLRFGRGWSALRAITSPLDPIIRLFVTSQIDYRADLGGGVRILHPQLGVVIGGGVTAGPGLILAGGNCIGDGSPHLGRSIQLGANASVVGDVTLGDGVQIGAGAVVVKDFAGPGLLVGVPAREVVRATT